MLISYILFGCLGFVVIASIPLGYRMCIIAFGRRPINTSDGTYENNRVVNRNRNTQLEENINSTELTAILAENNLIINNYKFIVCAGEQTKINEKGFNSIFFNETCILQGKYVTLNPESIYYEIELVDFANDFELLFGYADKSTSEIHESHILLNNKIYGVNVNEKQYPNTFVHILKKGDIIGCFYDLVSNETTFTYNGNDLCYYQFQSNTMYPTIYSTKGTLLKYNLGNQPFLYRRANQLKLGLTSNYVQEIPPNY